MISEDRFKQVVRGLLEEHLEAQSDLRSRVPSMVLIYPLDQSYLRTGFASQKWMLKLCCMAPGEEHTLEGGEDITEGETHPELGWYRLEDLGEWTGRVIKWAKSHEKILKVLSPRLAAAAEWVHQDSVNNYLQERAEKIQNLDVPESQLPPAGRDYLPISSDLIRMAGLEESDYRLLEGQGLIFLQNVFEKYQPCGNLHLFIQKGSKLWLCNQHFARLKAAREHSEVASGGLLHKSAAHQLPADITDFVGRKTEESKLLKQFKASPSEVAIGTITGMGGSGKSVLAFRVGNKLKGTYRDAQVVIDMQGISANPLTPVEALIQIIRAFDMTTVLPADLKLLVRYYRSLLEGKRVLIILDNAKDIAQVRPLLTPLGCGLLITSRDRIILEGGVPIDLDSLSIGDAIQLLKKILVNRRASDGTLRKIATTCGRLPLALRAAGMFLSYYQDWSVEEYLDALRNKKSQLELLKVQDIDVEASLSLSVFQLVRENSPLADRWRLLTVFPSDFDRPAAAAVWDATPEQARVDLSYLVSRTLLQVDSQRHRYNYHDLMRSTAQAFNGNSQQEEHGYLLSEAKARHAFYYARGFSHISDLYYQGNEQIIRAFALFDEERPNIEAAFNWVAAHYVDSKDVAALCSGFLQVGPHSSLLELRLTMRDWIEWLEIGLKASQSIRDKTSECAYLIHLGNAFVNSGKYSDGLAYLKRAHVLLQDIDEQQLLGRSLGSLGNAYAEMGWQAEAIKYYNQALDVIRKVGDRRNEGAVLTNLGLEHRKSGDLGSALQHHSDALDIAREIGDWRGAAIRLGDLGNVFTQAGETKKAITKHKEALRILAKLGDRLEEARARWNMSRSLAADGEFESAVREARAAAQYFKLIDHPSVDEVLLSLEEWKNRLAKSQ